VPTVVRRYGNVVRVFERHRDAVERAPDLISPKGSVGRDDRIDRRIVPFDPLEVGVQGLDGGQLPPSQPARQHACRQLAGSIGQVVP